MLISTPIHPESIAFSINFYNSHNANLTILLPNRRSTRDCILTAKQSVSERSHLVSPNLLAGSGKRLNNDEPYHL